MDYETIIGLEVHIQLSTESKMYCPCSVDYSNDPPNSHVCPVCLGLPGALPVINQRAVEYTVMMGLAMNCQISEYTRFDRKSYPYPDLMKGYQISQFDAPIAHHGWIDIEANGETRRISITRVHLEEDVSKLHHRTSPKGESFSIVDVNRSGVPLMETVSEPDIRSAEEARQYLMRLRSIARYLGISTANMEDGNLRCDANISLRAEGADISPIKVEVKNMNSFKAVYLALTYEDKRQREAVKNGERIRMETRGWSEERGITVSQRSKEESNDYRYFPEPDLPPLIISREWVDNIKKKLPELPQDKLERFMSRYGLSAYDASLLTSSKPLADYFENCLTTNSLKNQPLNETAKEVSNWLLGEFSRLLNISGIEIDQTRITPLHLGEMLTLINNKTINIGTAKKVLEEMFNSGKHAGDIVAEKNLAQIGDTDAINEAVRQVMAENEKAVADFKRGKEASLKYLLGQVMRKTKGRVDAKTVSSLLKHNLTEGEG
ncbi:MAG: Asp-tRNA(Asn)/Glu-tRNA(Gln) amidotransferase subunit GatB [Dehalococcoidia bacterium]|nr:Asp-tRNA(Asn)/Glu-tRNA(Gln) amidotransferase subunit GatB [Dehalococcoidia bacterium]